MIPFTFAALLLLSPPSPAIELKPTTRVDPSAEPEVQDVIFYTDSRPYLFRMRLRLDDKSFALRWEAHIKRVFAWYDRDGNGFLDKEEAERAPHPSTLANWLGGNLYGQPPNLFVSFAEMDADKDGKVSPVEFSAYYRANGAGPLRLSPGFTNAQAAEQITERLFVLLGGNKDAKVTSCAMFEKSADILLRLDQNDDELIASNELFSNGGVLGYSQFPVRTVGNTYVMPANVPSLFLVEKENHPKELARRYKAAKAVLARYDKDNDGKLSRTEIGFPAELFDRLDENKDGQLEAAELLRWLIVNPDVEAIFRMGKTDPKAAQVELVRSENAPSLQVHSSGGRSVSLGFSEGRIDLVPGNGQQIAFSNYTNSFLMTFRNLDKDKKGFITAKQIDEQRQVFFKSVLQSADRDSDGKLTEKELLAWLDLMSGGNGCIFSLTFAENGRGLFDILDANGDGRLSVREMRNAWSRLAQYDRDKKGAIVRTDIPRQFQMSVAQGITNFGGGRLSPAVAFTNSGMMPVSNVPQRGPLWFRKMDTNGDGDVSRREFLGSAEEFRRLDADGDGLISIEEAERADALLCAKAAKK